MSDFPYFPLRRAAGVSEKTMNEVYDILRNTPIDVLVKMREKAWDVWNPQHALLRHQIGFTVARLLSGRWKPDGPKETEVQK